MNNRLYVGNLPFSASEDTLHEKFSQCGSVESVKLITDRDTGRSKGFAFIEMSTEKEADEAISTLDNTDLEGRALKVSQAKPQENRNSGSNRQGNRNRQGGGWNRGY